MLSTLICRCSSYVLRERGDQRYFGITHFWVKLISAAIVLNGKSSFVKHYTSIWALINKLLPKIQALNKNLTSWIHMIVLYKCRLHIWYMMSWWLVLKEGSIYESQISTIYIENMANIVAFCGWLIISNACPSLFYFV